MLLAIDIGNTHAVLGLYQGKELLHHWRMESDLKRSVDEYAMHLLALLSHAKCQPEDVERIILSSVVPSLTRVFRKLASKSFESEPIVVGPELRTGMQIDVDDPQSVGSDRIVNAVACIHLVGTPAIVVDFGTATTFDVISADAAYVGGIIAPGVLISAEALFERAALLPQIELSMPDKLVGKNTRDSMLSGVYYGYVALVEGIIARLRKDQVDAEVIATGGIASLIAPNTESIGKVIPDLTLEGLRIIAAMNRD